MTNLRVSFQKFFFPPPGSPPWVRILPYATLGAVTLILLIAGAYGWDYTNSSVFCGTACHTMPPEYAAYQLSPHARINCVECHIGREFVGNQFVRKVGDIKHIVALAFTTYEFPITANEMRPAPEICERCHSPEKFSDDSLREIKHYADDENNTPSSIFLTMKTGGGSKREGLGRGIHWHVQNRVLFYPTDKTQQTIPYVRVYNDDGSVDEFVDVTASFDPASITDDQLEVMDCITCHNRITHLIYTPSVAMDQALARGAINPAIPEIHAKGVAALTGPYATQAEAVEAIAALEDFYRNTYADYYAANAELIKAAIAELEQIYVQSVFPEQKADWNSHPSNVGHKDTPGCFRCHDGKHLNADDQAIRLECNVCHSIPVVAGAEDFVVNIEISRGPEPESHKNSNWIALHRGSFDESCSLCHNTANPGGTDNTSFCSNSACHGSVWTFAGLDAPQVAEIIAAQLPTPAPTAIPAETPEPDAASGPLTYASIKPLFEKTCGVCHGDSAAGGLNVLTYKSLMAGSKNGAVIITGDSAASKLVEVQSGQHFGNLSASDLETVKKWIDGGALEK